MKGSELNDRGDPNTTGVMPDVCAERHAPPEPRTHRPSPEHTATLYEDIVRQATIARAPRVDVDVEGLRALVALARLSAPARCECTSCRKRLGDAPLSIPEATSR